MDQRKLSLLIFPFIFIPLMLLLFPWLAARLGPEGGYLSGFGVYWGICLLLPRLLLGRDFLHICWREETPYWTRRNWLPILLLLITSAVAFITYFLPGVNAAKLALIILSIPLATINGMCEELLWRGLYIKIFPGRLLPGLLYPALGFAFWHLAPQRIFADSSSPWTLVMAAFFLGLNYGLSAYVCRSMKWVALSHSLNGVLAFSGMLASSLLRLFQ